MSIKRFKEILLLAFLSLYFQCQNDGVIDLQTEPNPVFINDDFSQMPFEKLSDYRLFQGILKDLQPTTGVIPFEPINALFTDYAHKKRFIWMPSGSAAHYVSDANVLDMPEGTIIVKNFYYPETLPNHEERLIESRMMMRINEQWIFATYIWNEDQTEAFLDMNGRNVNIQFRENGENYDTNYRIPSEAECFTCHKIGNISSPIGIKPQNLNSNLEYNGNTKNQLQKWVEKGFLDEVPSAIETVIDWQDESQDLSLRVRSYLDINCAHCHTDNAHCDYTPMRFAFENTNDPNALGICTPVTEPITSIQYIIESGNADRSSLLYRINTNQEDLRMPQIGKDLIHEEAVELMQTWINALETNCN